MVRDSDGMQRRRLALASGRGQASVRDHRDEGVKYTRQTGTLLPMRCCRHEPSVELHRSAQGIVVLCMLKSDPRLQREMLCADEATTGRGHWHA